METDVGRLCNRIWSCVAHPVRKVKGRQPEEGIAVLAWSFEELSRAAAEGRFNHALHMAVLMAAVLRGKVKL